MAEITNTTGRTTSSARGRNTTARTRKAATTKRSTAAKKAAGTRARNSANARTRQATRRAANSTQAKTRVEQVQDYAERAVLIPVGAALETRDALVEAVGDVVGTYSTRTKAERQLKSFERRGRTARTQLERQIRKNRTRVERELRQRRTRVERALRRNRTRVQADSKSFRRDLEKQGELLTSQVENAIQTGVTAGQKVVSAAQERISTTVA
jgi:hypothetical protein